MLLLFPILSQAWQLEPTDEESTVQVWTQDVVNSNFKAYKGYVEIEANIHHVLSEIKTTETMHEWYHNTIEANHLQKLSDHQWLTYSVTVAPWPITDRDSVTQVTEIMIENGFESKMVAMPHSYPLQEKRIRIPKLDGFWRISRLTENKTAVTLQIATEPGGESPSWLANSLVIDMPFYSLQNFKSRLEKL